MQFFTPELYVQYNSADENLASSADELWEKALGTYQRHLDRLRAGFTASLRRLSKLCLHDASLLTFIEYPAFAIIALQQDGRDTVLLYRHLWNTIRKARAPGDWPFANTQVHWLYDEIDSESPRTRRYWHRILWSDGQVWEIPFTDVLVTDIDASFAVPTPTAAGRTSTRRGLSA
jgi:hypothetical protein